MAGYLNTKGDQGTRADSRPGAIITYHLPSTIKYRATGAHYAPSGFSVLLKVAAHLSGYGELLI